MKRHMMLCTLALAFVAGCSDLARQPASPDAVSFVAPTVQAVKPGGSTQVVYNVDATAHSDGGSYLDPTWVSTSSGTTGNKTGGLTLFVRWPVDSINITPKGSSYALTDEGLMSISRNAGKITKIQLFIQDVSGEAGIQHETDLIPIVPAVPLPSSGGFTLHVHADHVPVWRLKGHTGGPRVAMIGTISVGDMIFVSAP